MSIFTKNTITPLNKSVLPPKTYKGFSTVNTNTSNYGLFDTELIKQDIINHFYTRQGERLMNPTFGTIIWDMIFEPLTEQTKSMIVSNVNEIINYDPRVQASNVIIDTYDQGITIKCTLTYVQYNVSEVLQLTFDQANGLIAS